MKLVTRLFAISVFAISFFVSVSAQVSITTVGTGGAYSQDFNSLGTADFNLTNNSSLTGVYAFRSSGNASPNVFTASTASTGTGDFKNYGSIGNADRTLGTQASGNSTGDMYLGVRLQNDSGQVITTIEVQYTGEQWRTASGTAQVLAFSYRQAAGDITDLTTGTYTNAPVLSFTTPINTTPASGLNGNDPANRQIIRATIAVTVPVGEEIMLRWLDVDDIGTDHGAGIDDVIVTARAGVTAADATLAGQVRTADGRGVARVRVLLSGGNLPEPRYALTNPFGYFSFEGLDSGEAYLVQVFSKRYRFEESSRFVNLTDNITDVDFVTSP